MFKFCFPSILLVVLTSGFNVANFSPNPQEPVRTPAPNAVPKTVQIYLDADADVMIQNSEGLRIGLDFKSRQFVNEIPAARVIAKENGATYVLPFDKSGGPYQVTILGKSAAKVNANLSLTGPGFVVGFRGVPLTLGQVQTLSLATNGVHLSLTASQDGPTPQIFLTTQSGRGQPSYRFEVASSQLKTGKTITVDLEADKGRLYFRTDDATKDSFTVMVRRTNPGGTRDVYTHKDVSFSSSNSYAVNFGDWDAHGDMCFAEVCDRCKENPCTKLKNETSPQ